MYLAFISQFLFHLTQCKNIRTNSYDYNSVQFTKTNHKNYSKRNAVIFLANSYHILLFASFFSDLYTSRSLKFSFQLVISFGIFIYRMALFNASFLAYSSFIHDELLSFLNRALKFERTLHLQQTSGEHFLKFKLVMRQTECIY